MKKKLLWVGDSPAGMTGFGQSSRGILDVVRSAFDVTVLGINATGDPHDLPYEIYTAHMGGDAFGIGRIVWMCDLVNPDVIVIQQDPWNFAFYLDRIKSIDAYANIPIIGIVAVDGQNCAGQSLNRMDHCIFWTQFGLDEAKKNGFTGASSVIPLGVDLSVFHPIDKLEARSRRVPKDLDDVFIVGNVNRNQPRKRLDLTIRFFAKWIAQYKIEDAWLYLHIAPTSDKGIEAQQLASYYHMPRMVTMQPQSFYGLTESQMVDTYNCFDVQISTTQGEGFGLTTLEGMACGVPQIVPDWSALGEWAKGAAWLVPCTSTAIGPPYVNVIGGVPDEAEFIRALNALYRNKDVRRINRQAALERAGEERFRWPVIGKQVSDVLTSTLEAHEEGILARQDDNPLKTLVEAGGGA